MEDLFGTILFILFLVFSVGGRIVKGMRRQQPEAEETSLPPRQKRPTWPGPVAGPGVPGFPRPEWPDARPAQQAPSEVRRQPSPPAPPQYSGEGYGMEGAGLAPTTEEGVARFEAAGQRFRDEGLQTEELSSLERATDGGPSRGRVGRIMLGPHQVAQAVVMAEVLGRPLALRRRR